MCGQFCSLQGSLWNDDQFIWYTWYTAPDQCPINGCRWSFPDHSIACLIVVLEHRKIVFISPLMSLSSIAWSIARRPASLCVGLMTSSLLHWVMWNLRCFVGFFPWPLWLASTSSAEVTGIYEFCRGDWHLRVLQRWLASISSAEVTGIYEFCRGDWHL